MEQYKSMFEQAVRTLAAIDEALGIGDDGCADPDMTLTAIEELKAAAQRGEALARAVMVDQTAHDGGELHRELQQARHDLMVRETVKDERIGTLDAAGHRLALELECLLLDTKDLPTVSRWWDSGMESLEEWRRLFPYNGPRLGD